MSLQNQGITLTLRPYLLYDFLKAMNHNDADLISKNKFGYPYKIALWVTPLIAKNKSLGLPKILQSSKNYDMVADNVYFENLTIVSPQIVSVDSSVDLEIHDIDKMDNIKNNSSRLCITIYKNNNENTLNSSNDVEIKKTDTFKDESSNKIVSLSFDIVNVLLHVKTSMNHLQNSDYTFDMFVLSFPLVDYCTKIGFDSESHKKERIERHNSDEERKNPNYSYILGSIYLVFYTQKTLNNAINITDGTDLSSSMMDNFIHSTYNIAMNIYESDAKNENNGENPSNLLNDCLELVWENSRVVDIKNFSNDPNGFSLISKISNMLHEKLGTSGILVKSHIDRKLDFLINTNRKAGENRIRNWFNLDHHTKTYIKNFQHKFTEGGSLILKNRKKFVQNNYIDIEIFPDIPNLKKFKRLFWIIDNLKVPYPHYTKLCTPEFCPFNIKENRRATSESDQKHIPDNTKETEALFVHLLKISCLKYGLSVENFVEIIESAFLIDLTASSNHKFKFHRKMKLERGFLIDNSNFRFKLLKCLEILGDMLCIVSYNMSYKFDTRYRRYVHKNNKRTKNRDRHPNNEDNTKPQFTPEIQNVDSLDFDALAGLNEEGDCDETGLFILYVFCLICKGAFDEKTQKNVMWKDKSMKAVAFLCFQYCDYCLFGVVDEPKFGGNGIDQNDDVNAKKSKKQLEEENPDLLYNKYDMNHPCNVGHTFITLGSILDIIGTYKMESYLTTHDIFPEMGGGKDNFLKTLEKWWKLTFSYVENEDDSIKEYLRTLSHSLPRLILEGTGRQNSLALYGEYYYNIEKDVKEMTENYQNYNGFFDTKRSHIIKYTNSLYDFFRGFMTENIIKNNDKEMAFSLNHTEYCDYQRHNYQSETTTKTGYKKRCIDFYRRITQSTSQVIRFCCKTFGGDNGTELSLVWDNLIWVNLFKDTWGVPTRHVLECSSYKNNQFNGVLPIPVVAIPMVTIKERDVAEYKNKSEEATTRPIYETYYTLDERKESKEDIFVNSHISNRLPPGYLSLQNINMETKEKMFEDIPQLIPVISTQPSKIMDFFIKQLKEKEEFKRLKSIFTEIKKRKSIEPISVTIYWETKLQNENDEIGISKWSTRISQFFNLVTEAISQPPPKKKGEVISEDKELEIQIKEKFMTYKTLPWFKKNFLVVVTITIY